MTKAYCTSYFTGKVLWLPINPQKLRNFFTSNDLQYKVAGTIDSVQIKLDVDKVMDDFQTSHQLQVVCYTICTNNLVDALF